MSSGSGFGASCSKCTLFNTDISCICKNSKGKKTSRDQIDLGKVVQNNNGDLKCI